MPEIMCRMSESLKYFVCMVSEGARKTAQHSVTWGGYD